MPETTNTEQAQADKGYTQMKYTQDEVKYTDYAVRRSPVNSVCQTCRFFIGHDPMMSGASNCHIVECYPLDIVGTGYCNQWTARKVMEPEPLEVVIVEESDDMDSEEMEVGMMARKLEGESYGGAVLSLKKELDALWQQMRSALPGRKKTDEKFTAFKALGNGLWFAVFSNNFLDRDGEIITEKAWDRYLARAQSKFVPMPELWLAHIRGTKHGQALWVGKAGHMIWAAGKFDDTPAGKAAEKYYKKRNGDTTMSHAFAYPIQAKKTEDLPEGVKAVYDDLTVFEITTLEPGEEANPFTDFKTLEELEAMPISDKERERIKAVFGQAADTVLANAEVAEKAGEIFREIGTAYKSYVDTTEPTENAEKGAVEPIGAELLSDVLIAQGDVATALKGIEGKTLAVEKTATAEMAALKARVAQLETLLETAKNATPASEAPATAIPNTGKLTPDQIAALPAEIKAAYEALEAKQTGSAEFDPFFGDLKVKKAR